MLVAKGYCDSSRNRTVKGNFEKVLGVALIVFAGLALCAVAQCTTSSDEGDCSKGHFFPYSQYPHGHLDVEEGSTVFEPLRSQDNEGSRKGAFFDYDICIRGIGTLTKQVGDQVIHCLNNGIQTIPDVVSSVPDQTS